MVLEMRRICQSRRCVDGLRKCTRQEDRAVLSSGAARAYEEDDILSALHRRLDLRKIVRTIYRLFVHFQNYVAAVQAKIFSKRSLFYILHNHAFAGRNIKPVGKIAGDAANRNTELAGLRLFFALVFLFLTQTRSEELRPVGNGYSCFLFLAIADESHLGFRT